MGGVLGVTWSQWLHLERGRKGWGRVQYLRVHGHMAVRGGNRVPPQLEFSSLNHNRCRSKFKVESIKVQLTLF